MLAPSIELIVLSSVNEFISRMPSDEVVVCDQGLISAVPLRRFNREQHIAHHLNADKARFRGSYGEIAVWTGAPSNEFDRPNPFLAAIICAFIDAVLDDIYPLTPRPALRSRFEALREIKFLPRLDGRVVISGYDGESPLPLSGQFLDWLGDWSRPIVRYLATLERFHAEPDTPN